MRFVSAFLFFFFLHNVTSFLIARSFPAQTEWYMALSKAPWHPPAYVFAPVWFLIYTLISLSLTMVLFQEHPLRMRALVFYFVQLVFNFSWTPVFFGLHAVKVALCVLFFLDYLVFYCLRYFYEIDAKAAYLLFPYLFWLIYATTLNAYIVFH